MTPSPGGTSTGSNLVWYDVDVANRTFTATWDDVGSYNSQTNKVNAFQLSIVEIDNLGDFDIVLRELYPTKSDLYERSRELQKSRAGL